MSHSRESQRERKAGFVEDSLRQRKRHFKLNRGRACHFGPGMTSTCFTYLITDCSILFHADFWVYLGARKWTFDVMHIREI